MMVTLQTRRVKNLDANVMFFNKLDPVFYTIFESAPDATLIVDGSGVVQLVNTQFKKLFGYENDEIVGKEVERLIPENIASNHRSLRKSYGDSPKPRGMGHGQPLLAVRKDGTEFYAEISLSAMKVDKELFVSAAVRDVTEKRQMTEQLALQDQKIKEQNGRLVNFAHVVSHNLRSYGSNIASLLVLLERANHDDERNTIMEHLKSLSVTLDETVDHLSEVVSIQTDINQKREKLNLRSYVAKTIEVLSGEIDTYNAHINNDVSPGLTVDYVPAYLESILLNLFSNGLKYRSMSRPAVVNVEARIEDLHLILLVSDNGLGIDLAKFGTKLFNMRATFHGNPDARGLGLFITRNQVEAMGGKIEVESEVGIGTTFKVYLS